MKPVFKCDYCNFMDTEDKVKEHEINCTDNYDRKSCYTCVYKKINCSHNIGKDEVAWIYECKLGKEIPYGKIFEFCPQYERKEGHEYPLTNIFGGLFGGAL